MDIREQKDHVPWGHPAIFRGRNRWLSSRQKKSRIYDAGGVQADFVDADVNEPTCSSEWNLSLDNAVYWTMPAG